MCVSVVGGETSWSWLRGSASWRLPATAVKHVRSKKNARYHCSCTTSLWPPHLASGDQVREHLRQLCVAYRQLEGERARKRVGVAVVRRQLRDQFVDLGVLAGCPGDLHVGGRMT